MTSDSYEDINDVLDDVIVKINRITDHVGAMLSSRPITYFQHSYESLERMRQPINSLET